ncbi:hypothetical protein J6T93_04125 [bacterium]|nr:hypothetical protein [bacterium]
MRSTLILALFLTFASAVCLWAEDAPAKEGAMEMTVVTATESAEPAELTQEQIKEAERLANIKSVVWNKIYLTMPFKDVTNVMSGALEIEAPTYPYKDKAYIIAAVDDTSGSTNKLVLAARLFFFDAKDELLAMEHIFNGCTVDQKNYILSMYSRKYTMIPIQAKDHSFFRVTDGIDVVVEFLESKTQMNIYGWNTPSEYTVRATYFLEKEFVSLVNRNGLTMLPPEIAHP